MSSSKQSPASLRYLKARFRFLKRPAFWCSAVVLLLMTILAGEYFAHPEWLNTLAGGKETENEQAADSNTPATDVTLSPEELAAIGADIDSSAVLKQELEAFNVQPPPSVPNQKSTSAKSEGLFDQMARETASKTDGTSAGDLGYSRPNDVAKDKQKASNPFVASAQELLNANLFMSGSNDAVSLLGRSSGAKQDKGDSPSALSAYTPALGVNGFNSLSQNQNTTSATSSNYSQSLGVNGFNSLSQNQNTTQISPLQAALNQVAQSSAAIATTTTPTNALGQTLVPSTSTGFPALPSGVSSANYIPQNPSIPNPANSYTNLTPPPLAPSVPAATSSVPAPLPSTNFVPYTPQSSGVPNPVFSSPYSNQEIRPGQLSQPANSSPSYFPRK